MWELPDRSIHVGIGMTHPSLGVGDQWSVVYSVYTPSAVKVCFEGECDEESAQLIHPQTRRFMSVLLHRFLSMMKYEIFRSFLMYGSNPRLSR